MLPSNYVCQGQMTIFDFLQESQSGKTSQEPSAQMGEKTSDVCLKNWQESKTPKFQYLNLKSGCQVDVSNFLVVVSHGEPTMLNIGESPNEERESHLSWILETNPNPKYNLSPVACQGILRRATTRGKKLPELLEKVLKQQSVSKNGAESPVGEKESLFNPTTLEHCPPPTIKPLCIGNGQTAQLSESDKVGALNCMHDQQAIISPTNSEPILLESNQNHATIQTDGISTALPASMGMGGGYVPMVVDQGGGKSQANVSTDLSPTLTTTHGGEPAVCVGIDVYNQTTTGDKSKSLNSAATDSDHVPCVCYGVTAKGNGDAFLHEEVHTSLSTGGGEPGQGYPCVCYGIDQQGGKGGANYTD